MANFSVGGDWSWGGTTTFSGTVITPSLPNAVTVNAVYYDISSHELSFGAAGGGGGSWSIGGNSGLSDPSIFGTLDSSAINFQTNGITFLSVNSTQDLIITGTSINATLTTGISLDAPNFNIAINTATTLFLGNSACTTIWDSSTFNFNGSSTATFTSLGDLTLDSNSQVFIANNLSGVLTLGNSSTILTINSSTTTFVASSTSTFDSSTSLSIGTAATNLIQIGKTGAHIFINSDLIVLPALPGSAPLGSVAVLWDPITNLLYHV